MGRKGHGKGHGRGPPRSEEERQHARQVNAARAAEGLATKSTGSVSRSKAASGETSPHNKGKKRLQAPDCEGAEKTRTKQGEVLPTDKRALEATSSDSSTESDGGVQLLPVLALPHGSVESDFAPLQLQRTSLRTLLLLSVMRKRI